MNRLLCLVVVGLAATFPAAPAAAQTAQCSQAQPVVTGLLDDVSKRLEAARLTNSAAAMRDAADDVQSALVDLRAQLAPCGQLVAAAGDAPAGHAMPGMAPAASQAPQALQAPQAPSLPQATRPVAPPAARTPNADPHAGHVMPGAAPSAAAGTAPARPAGVAPADPHAGMAMPAKPAGATAPPAAAGAVAATLARGRRPVTAIGELRCATTVDPKTAPRMLHGGRTYYFCSVEERAEFAKNPGRYVEAPPAGAPAAPAHAH